MIAASSWRLIFLINLPLGLIGAVLSARWATETPKSSDVTADIPGQLLGVATLGALAGATVEGGSRGFTDPFVLVGFAVAVALATAFVAVERRNRSPLLPLSLFRSSPFATASSIGLLINIAFYGLIFVLGLYFQTARGYLPLRTGLAFAPATAVVMLSDVLAGRVTAKLGTRTVVALSASVFAAALLAMLFTDRDTPYAAIVVQLMLVGGALGLIVPAMTSALLGSGEPERSGIASGTLNTARQAGSVVGVALFGAFAATSVVQGLRVSLTTAAVLAVLTAVLARGLVPPSPTRDTP